MKMAVIKTGGKQYLVKEKEEIFVDRLSYKKGESFALETLLIFDNKKIIELGKPTTKIKVKAEVVENLKADKIRVAKFKAKVRYRNVRGYRHQLTKIKIIKI